MALYLILRQQLFSGDFKIDINASTVQGEELMEKLDLLSVNFTSIATAFTREHGKTKITSNFIFANFN